MRHRKHTPNLVALILLSMLPDLSLADEPKAGDASKPLKRADLMLGSSQVQYSDKPLPPGDWSGLRRAVETRFRPTRTMITEDTNLVVALRQLARTPRPELGPPGRQLPKDEVLQQESHESVQRHYDKPAAMRAVEVTATTDAKGQILSLKVILSSGSQRFDDAAVEAVRGAFGEYPPDESGRPLVLRFRIRGAYGTSLPHLVTRPNINYSSTSGRSSYVLPIPTPVWGTFDESKGTMRCQTAFADKLETEVILLSVTPASE